MGKTILELFRSRNENTGEVAEKKYAPRDSKEIGIQTNSFLINNSSVYAINLARRNFGNRIGETFLEEDGLLGVGGVGIRPLYTLSTPVLYGTDVLRLETQRTDQTEGMKNSANGSEGSGGLLGGGIQKLKKATTSGLEKLGVQFPADINPTAVYENSELKNTKNISETPSILSEFKGDAAGNLAGKVLSQPATPDQLVTNAAGAAVSGIKTKVRGAIFGEKSTTGFADGDVSIARGTTINYGSSDDATPKATINISRDASGRRYSKTFNLPLPGDDTVQRKDGGFVKSNDYNESSEGFRGLARKYKSGILIDHTARRVRGIGGSNLYSKTFTVSTGSVDVNEFDKNNNVRYGGDTPKPNWINASIEGNLETTDDPGLAAKTPNVQLPHITDRVTSEGVSKYSLLRNNNHNGETKDIVNQSLSVRRGMQNGADIINQSGVIDVTNTRRTEGGQALKPDGTNATSNLGWYHDFIPLKINRLNDNKTIYFRSTITGLTETFSPSWDSANKFIGNPFNYYTYSGIERSVSFNLKVYALNGREMISMWDKLKFLAELTYPAGYTNTSAVVPPFIKFTLGSFYDRKEGFIESLTYTVDDNTPWEVGLNTVKPKPTIRENPPNQGYFFDSVGNSSVETKLRGRVDGTPLDNYRLPMIVDVQMAVKFVESRSNTTNAKLYDFGKPGSA